VNRGIGRLWILPFTQDSFIAFNAYGYTNKDVNSVLMDLGKKVFNTDSIYINKSRLKFRGDIPYINQREDTQDYDNIWLVSCDEKSNELKSVDFYWNQESDIYDTYCRCELCENAFPESEISYLNNMNVCESCIEDYFYNCDDCNTLVYRDDINHVEIQGNDYNICDRCLRNNYSTCNRCDELFNDTDINGEGNCELCQIELNAENEDDSIEDNSIERENEANGIQLQFIFEDRSNGGALTN
jgi:formylmethanofuran dehydrogenase subunit E